MNEIWKKIENYKGLYEVSNFGNVRDLKGNIKPVYKNNKGYSCLSLYVEGKTYHPSVHRLVAMAFLPNPNEYKQINHIDCNKDNNHLINLEWCDQHYNYSEGMKNFLYSKNENHFYAKLTNEEVKMLNVMFKLGFTRTTLAKIFNITSSSIRAIEKGISYRELGLKWDFIKTKYKDIPNIKIPEYIRDYFKDNTVLNTLIAQGKVSV